MSTIIAYFSENVNNNKKETNPLKCYSCDCLLESPSLDRPTGRYYCQACLEPTTETILRMEGKENFIPDVPQTISLDELLEEENKDEEVLYEE